MASRHRTIARIITWAYATVYGVVFFATSIFAAKEVRRIKKDEKAQAATPKQVEESQAEIKEDETTTGLSSAYSAYSQTQKRIILKNRRRTSGHEGPNDWTGSSQVIW